MAKKEKSNKLFALIGRNISYSFSKAYFTEKFDLLDLANHSYINFDVQELKELKELLNTHENDLAGMNVTIPYKEEIFDFLDEVDVEAETIGAVNTIKIAEDKKLKGYNTDYFGFLESLNPLLEEHHQKALLLGTGGASKAVAYALKKLEKEYKFVSRNKSKDEVITYKDITQELLAEYTLIINCTPLGTHPNIIESPAIPYQFLNNTHLLYDLIYNPAETSFLSKGKSQGATIKNGQEMLELQAEKAWEIWNS